MSPSLLSCRWREDGRGFQKLFSENSAPMWIFERDSLAFLAVNDAALRKYGWSRDALLCRNVADVRSTEDAPPLRKARETLLASPGEALRVQWRHRLFTDGYAEGESVWCEMRFADRAAVLVTLTEPATAAPESAGEVREVPFEQAAGRRRSNDAVIICDFDDRIVFWNDGAERLYGIGSDRACARPMHEVLPSAPKNPWASAAPSLLTRGNWSGEFTHPRADGTAEAQICTHWSLLCAADGEPSGVVRIDCDLAAAQREESRFLRTQRLETVGALAGGIAHDLNNILSPILMSIGVLRAAVQDPGAQRMLNIIESSAQRGTTVVKQIFTFARGLDGDRVLLQPKHLVNDVSKLIAPTLPRNIDLRIEFPADLWTVNGDAMQLHQLLLNLCIRARDAMPEGGTLTIGAENVDVDLALARKFRAAQTGPCVLLRVSDTSAGLSKEELENLFARVHAEPASGAAAAQHDLATVQHILEKHGGFFAAESGRGTGTVFRAFLPAVAESVKEAAPVELGPVPRGNGELVLVVDDEMLVRETLVQTLQTNGYEVYTAEDGSDALALYFQRRDDVDIVVTDLSMGQMDGLTLVRSLRRVNPAVRVIVSSAQLQTETVAILRSLGVTTFLDKPFTAEKLLRSVRTVLDAPAPGRG
jgi:signal transduction histidine kinase